MLSFKQQRHKHASAPKQTGLGDLQTLYMKSKSKTEDNIKSAGMPDVSVKNVFGLAKYILFICLTGVSIFHTFFFFLEKFSHILSDKTSWMQKLVPVSII